MGDSILKGEFNLQREHNTSSYEHKAYFTIAVITVAINIASSLATVVLNSLLLRIHIRNQKSPSRILVCNLAVTDILTGLVVQPTYVVHIIHDLKGSIDSTAFLVFSFAAYLVCGMSLVTAGGMSVDRLLATVKPFVYKSYGNPKIFGAIVVFIWVQGVCFVSLYTANVINNSLAQLAFTLTVAFAVISFIVSYAIILKSIRRRERRVTNCGPHGPNTVRSNQQTRKKKITVTFALMVITICLMYLPMFIVKLLLWQADSSQLLALNIANRIANTVTFLNSLLNPLLYIYNNVTVRRQMKDMCSSNCFLFRQNQPRPLTGANGARSNFILVSSF